SCGYGGTIRSTPAKARSAVSIDRVLQSARTNNRGRSVDVDRYGSDGLRDSGLRRALPVPPFASGTTARANDLCDLPGDSPQRDRILPRSSLGRHSEPRYASAHFALALR